MLREAKQSETAHFQADLALKARIAKKRYNESAEQSGDKLPKHLTTRQIPENLGMDKT